VLSSTALLLMTPHCRWLAQVHLLSEECQLTAPLQGLRMLLLLLQRLLLLQLPG
jgi:hypothetical protein